MARLTKRYPNGNVTIDSAGFIETQETIDREIQNFAPAKKAVEHLVEYEDAEENGQLIHLPCKVGGTVYELSEGFVEECTVEIIFISNYTDDNGETSYMAELHYEREDCPYISTEIYFTDIGKTVFLTREEAEQALKARENETAL